MIQIASNIESIIAGMKRSKQRILDAHRSVLEPDRWESLMKSVARDTLMLMVSGGEEAFIKPLVDSVIYAGHTLFGVPCVSVIYFAASNGFVYEMEGQSGMFNAKDGLTASQIDALAPGIFEWVATQKDKTSVARPGRPAGDFYVGGRGRSPGEMQSNSVIADRIIAILKHEDQTPWLESTNTDGLLAFLKEHYPEQLSSSSGLTSLGESRLSELILAVLDAWQEELGMAIQSALIAEVGKAID